MTYNLKCFLFCLFLVVTIFIFLIDIKSKLVKPFEMIASETNRHESSLNVNATALCPILNKKKNFCALFLGSH